MKVGKTFIKLGRQMINAAGVETDKSGGPVSYPSSIRVIPPNDRCRLTYQKRLVEY